MTVSLESSQSCVSGEKTYSTWPYRQVRTIHCLSRRSLGQASRYRNPGHGSGHTARTKQLTTRQKPGGRSCACGRGTLCRWSCGCCRLGDRRGAVRSRRLCECCSPDRRWLSLSVIGSFKTMVGKLTSQPGQCVENQTIRRVPDSRPWTNQQIFPQSRAGRQYDQHTVSLVTAEHIYVQIANVGMPDGVKRRDLCPEWAGILGVWVEKQIVNNDADAV